MVLLMWLALLHFEGLMETLELCLFSGSEMVRGEAGVDSTCWDIETHEDSAQAGNLFSRNQAQTKHVDVFGDI
jgi:hypothetical protein